MWRADPSEDTRKRLAGGTVTLVGVLLLSIPVYDMWEDTTALDWAAATTLIENLPLLAPALGLVAGGVWLADCDWKPEHTLNVAAWTVFGTLTVTAIFAWVIYVQQWAMNDLKPYIIALDGIVIGGVTTFAIGVQTAKSTMRERALASERDRFSGLFENTTDAVATATRDDAPVTVDANDRFQETFDGDATAVLDAVTERLDDQQTSDLFDGTRDDPLTAEIQYDDREYLVRLIPHETEHGQTHLHVVATDVTEQKQLAREREANQQLELLHDFTTELEAVDTHEDAYELALDAVDTLLAVDAVWIVIDDAVAAKRIPEPGTTPDLTTPVGDRGHIELTGTLADHETRTVQLLATHLDRALERLDRERELAEEREQLEFVNRTLRHNLLNDIQVAQAYLQRTGDDFDADTRDAVTDRLTQMSEFVQAMRSYTNSLVGHGDRDRHPVELAPTLESVANNARDAHEHADITLRDIPDVSVEADELLEPMFQNLLANAIEHSDADTPTVRVDATHHGDTVTVRVADNGPGIPEHHRDDVFERGVQGDHSSGSGFGLHLVEEAVDAYGGSVSIHDADLGGAELRVTLPTA